MKRYLYILLAFLPLASCSLKEDTSLYVSPDEFCSTIGQCDAAVASTYTQLNTVYALAFEIAMEGCTDLYHIRSGTQDAQMDVSPASPRFGNTMWEYAYAGVRNANYALYGMANSGLDENDLKPLIAEAKIMRAYWYYMLTSFFGDVPFWTEYIQDLDALEAVRQLQRMSADTTRATLIRELKDCLGDLPQARRCDVVVNGDNSLQRAGASMGYMVMAKMAMWNKDWESAIWALEILRNLYGELSQYPLSDVPYSVKNTPESIFEVQHTYSASGLKVYSNLGAVAMPYPKAQAADSTYTFNGVAIPELGTDCVAWQPLRPNKFLHSTLFSKSDTKDKRQEYTLARTYNKKDFSTVWSGPKFWCYNMYNTYDHNNYTIFRYADALLMLAECYNEVDRPDEAIACLDEVKSRAGIDLYGSFRTKEKLLEEIQNERGRELAGEFQRKFDLVRWGIWYQRTYQYTDYADLKNNIRPYHEYYPIPDTQVALSGGMLDNKAYEQGL